MATFMQLGEILLAFIFWLLNFLKIGLLGVVIFGPIVLATMFYLAKHPNANLFDNHKQD
nr:MAG TPA: hypothetical protein [Caudoviricetes sp.]